MATTTMDTPRNAKIINQQKRHATLILSYPLDLMV